MIPVPTFPQLVMALVQRHRLWKRNDYLKHRAKRLDQVKARYQTEDGKAKVIKKVKAWYLANKERKAEYDKVYGAKNRVRFRKSKLAYYHRNPERQREWERQHREQVKASRQKWVKAHPVEASLGAKRRRARLAKCKSDSTAETFYAFVRSKTEIPCYYCGEIISGKEAHIDHVIAITKQGNHASENLCASCQRCNQRKGNKLPSEIQFLAQKFLDL